MIYSEIIMEITRNISLEINQFISVSQSCLTLCDPMMQHREARLPCPSPSPGGYSDSCPSHWWCQPTISSSVIPFSSRLQSSQHQGLFKRASSLHQVTKGLEFQLQHQPFQWIFRTDFLEDGLIGSPWCPRDSHESSPTPRFKSINSSALSFLYILIFTSTHDYRKNHRFD